MHANDTGIRVPPHSIAAEQSVIGAVLIDARAWDRISGRVKASDFYLRDHRIIFGALEALTAAQSALDVVTVSEYLDAAGTLQEASTLTCVGELAKNTPSSANAVHYAKLVREAALLRNLISAGAEIQDRAFERNGQSASELIAEAERSLSELGSLESRSSDRPREISDVISAVVGEIEAAHQQGGKIVGLPSGFSGLDAKTTGFEPGQLIILAGRPSSGKTTLAMNIAENVAVQQGKPVQVFSLEMSSNELGKRLLSSAGRLDFQRLRTGSLAENEWSKLTPAIRTLSAARLHIDDTAALSPAELRARARRAHRENGPLALIVVDYLGLMRVPGIRADNRVAEVTEISRSLKALAKELNVPVVACSQLNRSLEQRNNKRPIMSDLRDSGAIEQDADLILFLYRDEVYNPDSQHKGIAELAVAKQRNGPTGVVYLTAALERMRFENFVGDISRLKAGAGPSNTNGVDRFEY